MATMRTLCCAVTETTSASRPALITTQSALELTVSVTNLNRFSRFWRNSRILRFLRLCLTMTVTVTVTGTLTVTV